METIERRMMARRVLPDWEREAVAWLDLLGAAVEVLGDVEDRGQVADGAMLRLYDAVRDITEP
jgi:hypothetical protein